MKNKYQQNLLAIALVGALAFAAGCSSCPFAKNKSEAARSSGEIEGHVLIAGNPWPAQP